MRKKNATSQPSLALKGLNEKSGSSSAAGTGANDGALPPIESLSGRPTMPAQLAVSPLELAHLTAALTQAHLVQGSPKEKATQAMDFLIWCGHLNEDLKFRHLAARFEQFDAGIIEPLLAKYAGTVVVPVVEIISAAKLNYLALERSELRVIGINVEFSSLTPELRASAVFRFLTRKRLKVKSVKRGAMTVMVEEWAFEGPEKWALKAEKGVTLEDILCGLLNHLQQSARALEKSRDALQRNAVSILSSE